jgi:RNA polymerase sigma-70 factor (ECF subfamily)
MTDTSLSYDATVTGRSVYATLMALGTGTMDATTSSQHDEIDRRRAAWMVAAQAGDRAAYETLLRDCIPFIKRVARGKGIRPDFVDDVVQETLLTVHRARQTYDPNRSFTAWLRTIAERRAIDGLRNAHRSGTREVYAPLLYENQSDPGENPEEAVLQRDRSKVRDLAISKLSAGQREAVEHLALQSQSLAQAAMVTGRPTGALRVDWHRALKSLRAQFGRKD